MFRALALAASTLALGVVVLGAWVRLTDAGLGCPDWPGCYGTLSVPRGAAAEAATVDWPERPLETGKAWREMLHRYFAGALGLTVFGLAVLAWRRRADPAQPVALPLALTGLIGLQALLGMWTVTLLLKPLVVLAHLLGGMAMLALLWWLALDRPATRPSAGSGERRLRLAAGVALAGLAVQIALGGWTSSNYAALACPDFPTCQGEWWPSADFAEGFVLWRGLGIDYTGGVLAHPARVAIHLTHRLGAALLALILLATSALALRSATDRRLRLAAAAVLALLGLQLGIGVGLVETGLPLALATAHNGVAALLLLAVVWLNRLLYWPRRGGA